MDEHRSSPMGNTELFLALTWPKQLNNNIPNQGTTAAQFHNGSDSNYAQSQTKDKQTPSMDGGEHSQQLAFHSGPKRIWTPQLTQKRGEDHSPKATTVSTPLTWENNPNSLCVRKNLHPTAKCTGKTYPISV